MPQIPDNVLKDFAIERGVSGSELEVMRRALEGQRVGEIAVTLGLGESTIWTRLRSVYSKFGIEGTVSGKLAVLKERLEEQYQALLEKITTPHQDKNLATNEVFYGRTADKNKLKEWLLKDRCQLVALLGIGGIGKTALAIELTKEIKGDFEHTISVSLRNALRVKELLDRLLLNLHNQQKPDLSGNVGEKISQLIQYFQLHRCLIVLDNAESILEDGEPAGVYRKDYQDYGELLRAVGESVHQSCLVITSRDKPPEVALLEEKTPLVKSRELEGLDETAAKKLIEKIWSDALKDEGKTNSFSLGDEEDSLALGDEEKEWKKLNNLLGGNPLVIKIISPTIKERYECNIRNFLEEEKSLFLPGGLRELLSEQFRRLSELEKDIMYWLAINRTPVSVSELQEDIIPKVPPLKLLKALESLSWRSLIEKNAQEVLELTLQPVIMEYMTEQLRQEIGREIRDYENNKSNLFNRFSLIKAQAKDYIKGEQRDHIIKPFLQELLISLGDEKAVEKKLKDILPVLHKQSPHKPGYAGGNIINLLSELKDKFIDKEDFSDLAVWQADLEAVTLHEVNFAYADLKNSTLAETLSSILSVAFDSTGKFLVTGEVNGKVRLWNVADGKNSCICKEKHSSWVQSVAFSRDGKMVASSSGDQTVKLWKMKVDAEELEYSKTLIDEKKKDTGPVRSVAFSPDGAILASGSDDGFVRLWNVDSGECINANELSKKHKHEGWVWSVAFSPDGTILASGSEDRSVRLWDGRKGFYIDIVGKHEKCVSSVAFSLNNGRITLASSSEDKTIKLWHPTEQLSATSKEHASWDNFKTLEGHTSWVWSVAFSPDGKTLASSSDDRTIRLWNVDTGEHVILGKQTNGIEEEHNNRIGTVAFSRDGKRLASGSEDQTVKIWDIETKKCYETLRGYTNRVGAVAFSPDGKTLASSSDDKTVKLWNVVSEDLNRKNIKTLKEHLNRVGSVAFSPDGKILASGSDDHTVKLWKKEKDTWRCFRTLKGHENRVSSIAFSPDGKILASGSDDHTVKLWKVKTGECTETLKHNSRLRSVAFAPKRNANSPDEKTLASVSDNEKVTLWTVDTEKGIKISSEEGDDKDPELEKNGNWVWSVAFSPDGKTLASGNYDHTVWLRDMDAKQWRPLQEKHKGAVRSVAFSPDGKILASGSDDHTVWLWDMDTKKPIEPPLKGHTSRVTSVAFSPDGKILASGSDDETIRLWEVKTGKPFPFPLKSEKLYQETDFTGVINLTDTQKATLKELGAIV
jgi:WD40 repeat protein